MTCPLCGKTCYPSKREAVAAFAPRAHLFGAKKRVRAYKCYSGYWHYGHISMWNGRRRDQGAW